MSFDQIAYAWNEGKMPKPGVAIHSEADIARAFEMLTAMKRREMGIG